MEGILPSEEKMDISINALVEAVLSGVLSGAELSLLHAIPDLLMTPAGSDQHGPKPIPPAATGI